MAGDVQKVLVVDDGAGSLSRALARMHPVDVVPIVDPVHYNFGDHRYNDDEPFGFEEGGYTLHEVLEQRRLRLEQENKGLIELWDSDYCYDDEETVQHRHEVAYYQALEDERTDRVLPSQSSCRGFGHRKEYRIAHDTEDERFGRRRWTDSKDHKRRKVRSRFFRKVRLMQSTALTGRDSTDPLDAFLDESDDMAEVVVLREMGFHDLAMTL